MTDMHLAGGVFSAPSFQAHRVIARLLDGDADLLDAADRELAGALTGRTRFPAGGPSELTLIAARRCGKSLLAATIGLHAAAQDYRDRLAPGEWATVGIAAPNTRQARTILDYVTGFVAVSPMLRAAVVREAGTVIEFEHRTRIEVFSSSHRTLRGYSFPLFIIDEAAQLRDELSATPDAELARAVRPALATLNGRLLVVSSPYMRRGLTYTAWRDHFGRDDSAHLVVKGDWRQLNPGLPAKVIEAAYQDDPASARSEWGGEFREDVDAALAEAWIAAAVDPGVSCRGPGVLPGSVQEPRYVGYADPAGGNGSDSYTVAVGHAEAGAAVLDALLEVRPPFSTDEATAQAAELLGRYGVASVQGDRYAGDWPRQALAKHGISYQPAELPTSDLYLQAVPLFSSGRVRLLDVDRLVAQLRQLERRVRAGGRDLIAHPVGGHDDLCTAACGALVLAARRQVAESVPVQVARSTLFDDFGLPSAAAISPSPFGRRVHLV